MSVFYSLLNALNKVVHLSVLWFLNLESESYKMNSKVPLTSESSLSGFILFEGKKRRHKEIILNEIVKPVIGNAWTK